MNRILGGETPYMGRITSYGEKLLVWEETPRRGKKLLVWGEPSRLSAFYRVLCFTEFSQKNIECSQGTSVFLRELHPALCCG